jgi:hypothetical protein
MILGPFEKISFSGLDPLFFFVMMQPLLLMNVTGAAIFQEK